MKRIFPFITSKTISTLLVVSLLISIVAGCSLLDLSTVTEQPANQSANESLHNNHSDQQSNGQTADQANQQASDQTNEQESSTVPANTFEEVAAYIRQHGELPSYYITKKEASELGWVPADGNLHQVAPGKIIGGDRFGNREGLLPKKEGRIWFEADINYNGGPRNADRIVFSNDGLIYMTTDHYKSFTDITEEGP